MGRVLITRNTRMSNVPALKLSSAGEVDLKPFLKIFIHKQLEQLIEHYLLYIINSIKREGIIYCIYLYIHKNIK